MAFSSPDQADIIILQGLSTHVVNILDADSKICSDNRLLTPANITDLNTLYGKVIALLDDFIQTQLGAI